MLIVGVRPALSDGPAPGEQTAVRPNSSEAALAAQVHQRKGRDRIELREAAHLEFSDADGPIPCFLSKSLNERAKMDRARHTGRHICPMGPRNDSGLCVRSTKGRRCADGCEKDSR